MREHLKVVSIAGSLRQKSYSAVVANAVREMLPTGAEFTALDIGEIPHYNEDVDHSDAPNAVVVARKLVSGSDLIVIVSPEFNHGIPGVLKNTLDWLSRPAFASCFLEKPVFFLTLSEGALGGVRAQSQLRETLSSMLCRLPPLKEIAITNIAGKVFDGRLTDATTLSYIENMLERLLTSLACEDDATSLKVRRGA